MYPSAQCTPFHPSLLACLPAYLPTWLATYLLTCRSAQHLLMNLIFLCGSIFFSVPLPGSSGLFWHPRMLRNLEVLTLLTSEVWRPSLLMAVDVNELRLC